MTFNANGTVERGKGVFETYWDIVDEDNCLYLCLSSDSNITCKLRKGDDGSWKGTWRIFEKMPVRVFREDSSSLFIPPKF